MPKRRAITIDDLFAIQTVQERLEHIVRWFRKYL